VFTGALEVNSLPELIELTLTHQRRQFATISGQFQELFTLTQRVDRATRGDLSGPSSPSLL